MPKSYNNLWERIVSFENLHVAFLEARKGKRYKGDVLMFTQNLEENIFNIQNHLCWRSWTPGRWREFQVYDPKWRLIQAPPFADRVVHHALVRVISPLFEKKFIFDSYACRQGKGTHAAVFRLQKFLRRAKRNWGRIYVLKADIAKYFASIDHDLLLNIIERTVQDKDVLWLCRQIVCASGYDRRGIPVGSLTSQLFANAYLDKLDHFIKDKLGVKHYVRYMDDFIILEPDKILISHVLWRVSELLTHDLKLTLNPKTAISPAIQGVDFAGYRIWATHILPRKRNTKKARRNFKKLAQHYANGDISITEVRSRVMSFLAYMAHCSSQKTTKNILRDLVLVKHSTKKRRVV